MKPFMVIVNCLLFVSVVLHFSIFVNYLLGGYFLTSLIFLSVSAITFIILTDIHIPIYNYIKRKMNKDA